MTNPTDDSIRDVLACVMGIDADRSDVDDAIKDLRRLFALPPPPDADDVEALAHLAREALDVHPVTLANPYPPERRLALGVLALRQKLEEAEAQRDALAKAAEPFAAWLAFVEAGRHLDGDPPLTNDQIVLHYMGNGASTAVTVGQVRALATARAARDAGGSDAD